MPDILNMMMPPGPDIPDVADTHELFSMMAPKTADEQDAEKQMASEQQSPFDPKQSSSLDALVPMTIRASRHADTSKLPESTNVEDVGTDTIFEKLSAFNARAKAMRTMDVPQAEFDKFNEEYTPVAKEYNAWLQKKKEMDALYLKRGRDILKGHEKLLGPAIDMGGYDIAPVPRKD